MRPIMAILDTFSRPHRDYYDWQVKPGEGYRATLKRTLIYGTLYLTNITPIGEVRT